MQGADGLPIDDTEGMNDGWTRKIWWKTMIQYLETE